MRRILCFLATLLMIMSLNGCSVSSRLNVTNSAVISQANFIVVKPLNERVTSTHFIFGGGWKVRNAKENVIQHWQKSLKPNQALANINFTESYAHFIPWIIYQEEVSISATVIEFKSDGNFAQSDNEETAKNEDNSILSGAALNLDVPTGSKSISLMSGDYIRYNPKVPMEEQILEAVAKVKQDYQEHKNWRGKSYAKTNLKILEEWNSLAPSPEAKKAIQELQALVQ